MKKFSLVVAAILMVVFVKAQDGDPCSQETPASGAVENGFGHLHLLQVANDLVIDADGTFTLNSVQFNALISPNYPVEGVELHFYKDSDGGNGPGDAMGSTAMLTPTSVDNLGVASGYDHVQISADLDESFTFVGSDAEMVYWVGVTIGFSGETSFMEVTANINTPNETYFFDSDENIWIPGSDPVGGFDFEADGIISFFGLCGEIVACSGQPVVGTINGPESVCAEVGFSLTASGHIQEGGISYQWQQSSDGGNTWEDIDGATSAVLNLPAGITEPTDYRFTAECENGGETSETDLVSVILNPAAECYCIPTVSTNGTDEILNFTLSDLSNDSDPSEGVDGYSDYSSSVSPANIMAGESYVASLTSGTGTLQHGAAIWIDYNDNGIFEASEMVASIPLTIEAETTVNFPPFTVLDVPGTHRLRVQYGYNVAGADMNPCATANQWAETEDYSVEVAEMVSCEGTPEAGVVIDDFSACPSHPFNISVTGASPAAVGLVRMWESSLAGTGDWSEIEGATSATYAIDEGIMVPMDYRFKLSCDEGEFVFSDVISVSISPISECYCVPFMMLDCFYTDDMIDDFILVGDAGTFINDEATGCSDDGYDDRTDQSVTLTQGESYTAIVTTGTDFSGDPIEGDVVAIWIDFNDDGAFDESERVASGELNTGEEITVSIPGNADIGEHRMRVIVYYADASIADEIDSCNDAGFEMGETHDYMVNIASGSEGGDLCGFENFDNAELTQSYSNGSFVGNNGVTWTYVASRDENGDENGSGIDGNAILLRRAADNSGITSSTISGGIGDFSVKVYKGFTGGGDRQIELFVNGNSYGLSDPFDDFDLHVFEVNGIDIEGDIVIEIINATEKQVIIDDITWTCGPSSFECPEFEANIGDDCENENGEEGVLDDNCDCIIDIIDNINGVAGFSFTMYPNPAGSSESVTLTSNQSVDRYEVLDITGKLVDANVVLNQNEIIIPLRNYSAGMYILKAYSGSDFSTQKMVVR